MSTWVSATTELMIAFVGGIGVGIFTTFISEYFSNKREHNALLLDRTASLVRAYHLYVRLLRQDPDNRTEEALDNTHATFVAEVRILGFNTRFAPQVEELNKIARRLVNIRTDSKKKEQKRAALSKIYKDFDDQLQGIMKQFR